MAKKKGLFSWLRKDKPEDIVQEQQQLESTEHVDSPVDAIDQDDLTPSSDQQMVENEISSSTSNAVESDDLLVSDTSEPDYDLGTNLPEALASGVVSGDESKSDNDDKYLSSEEVEAAKREEEPSMGDSSAEETIDTQAVTDDELVPESAPVDSASPIALVEKQGFFARLRSGLAKTRENIGGGIVDLFRGKKIDDELFEELETQLLIADVGVETTTKIIRSLTESASRRDLKDADALYEILKAELAKIVEPVAQPLVPETDTGPYVILMVGVNGVGKTTTIGKLAKQFQAQGKSVMLAAGDTFRAAAVEQLQVWGERNNIPVIAQHSGADSASVLFDAVSAAKARGVDVLIADTAGRLQNKSHLMEELKKVVRVMKKIDDTAPHEVMLTIDAGTGQNALSQAALFNDAVGLTGITLTKLDGTAKGGVVFAVADKYGIPIRYLGVGEGIDDLRPFNGGEFVNALFEQEK